MEICLVGSGIVQIPPEKGGAVERVIYDIAQAISDEHEVYVIDFGQKKEKIEEEGFQILRVPVSKTNPFLQKIKFGFKAREKIKQLKPDVIHLHTVFSGVPIASLKPPGKLIYTCHNPSWVVEDLDVLNSGVNILETFIMKKAERVTTVSDYMKRILNRKAGISSEKIDRIYNGVKFKADRKSSAKEEKNKKPVVLFLGKHIKHKGIHIFLKACDIINEKIPIRPISVGPFGRFGEDGEKFWEENELVEFWGAVSEERKREALELADVALYPTDRESMGIVFIESQAKGVPVVATDLPVCHESIVHGKTGLLVERDAKSFAEAALQIISENWKQTHKEEIFKWIKRFSKKEIKKRWLEFYKELNCE